MYFELKDYNSFSQVNGFIEKLVKTFWFSRCFSGQIHFESLILFKLGKLIVWWTWTIWFSPQLYDIVTPCTCLTNVKKFAPNSLRTNSFSHFFLDLVFCKKESKMTGVISSQFYWVMWETKWKKCPKKCIKPYNTNVNIILPNMYDRKTHTKDKICIFKTLFIKIKF